VVDHLVVAILCAADGAIDRRPPRATSAGVDGPQTPRRLDVLALMPTLAA
jgi:hypothetical protein